jgi:hypothetical protein
MDNVAGWGKGERTIQEEGPIREGCGRVGPDQASVMYTQAL